MEKKVLGRREAMARFEESPIYVITDEGQSAGRGNLTVVRAALEAGVKFVQYREKKKALRAMYEEGLLLRKLTAEYGAALIVDDFVDLAMLIGADGVHVGQDDLPAAAVRWGMTWSSDCPPITRKTWPKRWRYTGRVLLIM